MDEILDMLAAVVVTLAVAALSLFGVKVEPHGAGKAERPAVVSRTANTAPARAEADAESDPVADAFDADCPELKKAKARRAPGAGEV